MDQIFIYIEALPVCRMLPGLGQALRGGRLLRRSVPGLELRSTSANRANTSQGSLNLHKDPEKGISTAAQTIILAKRTMSTTKKERNQRENYRYWLPIQTRWGDNDMYGHVNNVVYYAYFDSIVNHFLISEAGLDPMTSDAIGLCIESYCNYYASLEYPEIIEAGLFVSHLGNSSLKYEVGIFKKGSNEPAAHGHFVHVFVDRTTRRPVKIPEQIASKVKGSLL
uniref:Dehydratase isomerase n=1 Tax=Aurantiochytrium sp. PKUSW7 TaxID=1768218 RepID=A0A345DF75_9STRA|nr:dehydratase isomerase [Aurantiochytrium sp. PKUSW7]